MTKKTKSSLWPGRALLALVAATALALAFLGLTAWRAWEDLHPPRVPLDPAPAHELQLQPLSFQAADGVRLAGWYRAPAAGLPPVVLLLVHGHGANRAQLLGEARLLLQAGYGVLLFDLRAHGQSGGTLATSGAREQLDVTAALAALRSRPELAGARFAGLGFSVGGTALAEVAAREPALAALVLEATPATLADDVDADFPRDRPLERWLARKVHEWVPGIHLDEVRPVDRLCALAPRPLLLIYGDQDPAFGAAVGARMRQAACGPVELWVVAGVGHGPFVAAGPEAFAEHLLPFLQRSLRGGAGPQLRTGAHDAGGAGG